MDIVHPGADLVRIFEFHKGIQQLHGRTRGFDGNHVGVERGDGLDNVVELGITHVGVNLGGVGRVAHCHAERPHGPVQVGGAIGGTQRQTLAERRLINLDNTDTGSLQIAHLVPNRDRDLLRGLGARLVVAHERPLQNRHRAGEHALHGAARERLCIRRPFHRHGQGARHIPEQDRWFDTPRPVTLYPPVLGEGKATQLLTEILDHVVTLGLAVHQHIEADLLLLADDQRDLAAHPFPVRRQADPAGLEIAARGADLASLWKRSDGSGWIERQGQYPALGDTT